MRPTWCPPPANLCSKRQRPISTPGPSQGRHGESRAGPLLLLSGELDHTVPPAVVKAAYKQQQDNEGVTEFIEIKNRGHGLTIDSGWREVAETRLPSRSGSPSAGDGGNQRAAFQQRQSTSLPATRPSQRRFRCGQAPDATGGEMAFGPMADLLQSG
jgi:hypothetical protein